MLTGLLLLSAAVFAAPAPHIQRKREDETYNWAGAAITAPTGQHFKSVTGSWITQEAKIPSGGNSSTQYIYSTWVGLDLDDILQAGVDSYVQNGQHNWYTWYELLPADPVFMTLAIDKGDKIRSTCSITGTHGSCTVENLTQGTKVSSPSLALRNPKPAYNNAEWVIEDISSGQGGLAAFDPVTFTSATAQLDNSQIKGPRDGTTLYDMSSDKNKQETASSVGTDEVFVKYIG